MVEKRSIGDSGISITPLALVSGGVALGWGIARAALVLFVLRSPGRAMPPAIEHARALPATARG